MIPERLPSIQRLPVSPRYHCNTKDRIIMEAKRKPCSDCGQRFPLCVMDFDHVRGNKLFSLGHANGKGITEEMVYAEIAKCDLVCANCHRIRTHGTYA